MKELWAYKTRLPFSSGYLVPLLQTATSTSVNATVSLGNFYTNVTFKMLESVVAAVAVTKVSEGTSTP